MSSITKESLLNTDSHRTMPADANGRVRSASALADDDLKHEDGGPDVRMADAKPTYKSWKKKYRKMRIKFDQKMSQGEDLYQQEVKAMRKIKQLAIYNDRLLDLLTDINNRPQVPLERRIDVSLDIPSDAEEGFILDIDREPRPGPRPAKSLKELIKDTPHLDFAATAERLPELAADLLTGIDSPAAEATHQQHPPSFLTADDIDNYLWEVDMQAKAEADERGEDVEMLPTLAPLARESGVGGYGASTRGATPSSAPPNHKDTSAAGASSISTTSRDFALRNPVSVYNWLRKNAPKTFLQDNEVGEEKKEKGHSGDKQSRKAHRAADDEDDDEETRTPARKVGGGGRKASGEGGRPSTGAGRVKGERASKTERVSKRSKAVSGKAKRQSMDETMYDLDEDLGVGAKASASKGKRKRVAVDDDSGYRPKGGSSRRPTKRRNKNNSVSLPSAGGAGPDDSIEAAGKAEISAAKKAAREQEQEDAQSASAYADAQLDD
ncbi:hypothetical protein J7T55_014630 [Diaporthe amygdali]|uniref:uncharacterized protein n=1 Tax=Phomopsis amygdali TaxID=1214568 RepID=UPI0022FEE5FB|nr:uncharacterized protein J7T55_014630 [Diaporthe amygdali]KAJ0107102.1 hypothetical protein J7T55_014630 [Diaporthe amygdali]